MMLAAGLVFGGGMALCCCCDCECCEPNDDWNIMQDARHGERGAGWMYKRAKSKAIWSKRFFVLTETKLIYYGEVDRNISRGEIVMAGATAMITSTRKSTKKCKYFSVSHPECGEREFYVKTSNRRTQWINAINELSTSLIGQACTGKIFKQGGLTKSAWQERWAICIGTQLDYFDSPTENQPKGSIDLVGSKVKIVSTKDQKYCFELACNNTSKKGTKKYIFSVEKEGDQKKWVEALTAGQVKRARPRVELAGGESGVNPMVAKEGGGVAGGPSSPGTAARSGSMDMDEDIERVSVTTREPQEMNGYLWKKSPSAFQGYQKRYFTLKSPGELTYYGSEEDCKANYVPKGSISLSEVPVENGLDFVEGTTDFVLHVGKKAVPLRAATTEEAESWAVAIGTWIVKSKKK